MKKKRAAAIFTTSETDPAESKYDHKPVFNIAINHSRSHQPCH